MAPCRFGMVCWVKGPATIRVADLMRLIEPC